MSRYQVKVEDIVKRKVAIAQKCKQPMRLERFYHYTTDGMDLPVIALPLDLPIYRMVNYRTRTRQRAYVHAHNKTPDFFKKGEENVGAQRAQHELLVDLAKKSSGESIISIVRKLEQDQRQTESLLLTHEGVVVNGNRRLAAMRELYVEESDKYRTFEYVHVAILPEYVTAPELKKIEVQLQMQQETKLPYDWTDECIAVRELANDGMSKQEITRLMRLEKDSEVQAMIERLGEAEMYLTEYLENPDAYEAIEHQQQQFIELQRALEKKNDSGEKELARKNRLLQAVVDEGDSNKLQHAVDFCTQRAKEGRKVVVWTIFRDTIGRLERLMSHLNAVTIFGDTPTGKIEDPETREGNPRYIEVKATSSDDVRFYLTRNEWRAAERLREEFVVHLWRLPSEKLREVTVQELSAHIPQDRGHGLWEMAVIGWVESEE